MDLGRLKKPATLPSPLTNVLISREAVTSRSSHIATVTLRSWEYRHKSASDQEAGHRGTYCGLMKYSDCLKMYLASNGYFSFRKWWSKPIPRLLLLEEKLELASRDSPDPVDRRSIKRKTNTVC